MGRLLKALLYSLAGLRQAWADEAAFRQEVMLAVLATPVAIYVAPHALGLGLMLGSLLLVMVVELLNTGIEAAINRHGSELHPESKKAKDCASAAVLLSIVLVIVVWASVLLHA